MIVVPKTQVLSSSTFTAPPIEDPNITLPELYDFNYEHSPNHPLFVYNDGGVNHTITWGTAVRAVHRASYIVDSIVADTRSSGRPIVAILATSDTITFFAVLIGIMRAGCTVFTISPRNGPQAVAHLLEKTNTTHLFVSAEPAIQALSAASLDLLSNAPKAHPLPLYENLYPVNEAEGVWKPFPKQKYELDATALIIHSSGSTSFPKPIYRTHRGIGELTRIPWYGGVDSCGLVFGCHAVPLFHGMGILQVNIIASTGMILGVFKPSRPATVPTPENTLEGAVATNSDVICCAPTFLESWSRVPESVENLKRFHGIMYGGGPLNKDVGDALAAKGVSIINAYSCTECGQMSQWIPAAQRGLDWEYFQFASHVEPVLKPYPDGTVEVIVKTHEALVPMTINAEVDGVPAYATSDLLIQHPTMPHLFKIYGRVDDQIMLSTGEKTNPGPLETILCQDPKVQAAVIFGRGQPFNGVVVAPKPEFVFDPSNEELLEQFRAEIWPTVERMNAFAPTHSRIFKEMVLVESPSKPFMYTAKSTVRRALVISDYDTEIKDLYENVSVGNAQLPDEWTADNVYEFVAGITTRVMNKPLEENDDFFQYGCDSLQATWIQNAIRGAITKTLGVEVAGRIPANLLYQYPSIVSLSAFIWTIMNSADAPAANDRAQRATQMLNTLNRFNSQFPAREANLVEPPLPGKVVMLVGSTGGFGSGILYHLISSPDVSRVYALNRKAPNGANLRERQEKSLDWDEARCLQSDKVVLLEADMSVAGFGVDPAVYQEMHSAVTHIILNAWRVDFNAVLSSFEANIRMVRNSVDFALSSKLTTIPRLLYISSVAVFNRPKGRGIFAEIPYLDPDAPVGTGYGEAKWIGEQILAAAAEQAGLRPVVVRLGQIVGNRDGYWNEREWFPLIVKSATVTGCIPNVPGTISWIPSFDAAKALTEFLDTDRYFLHLAHPKPITWSYVAEQIAQAVNATLVSYPQWLESLEKDLKDPSLTETDHLKRNPALKILKFYENIDLDEDREPLGIVRLGTTEAAKVSPSLAALPALGPDHVQGWLNAWKGSGFIGA